MRPKAFRAHIFILGMYRTFLSIHHALPPLMVSLTGIEPVWFEMENSLPYCVEKA